jgi:hypothetical protein
MKRTEVLDESGVPRLIIFLTTLYKKPGYVGDVFNFLSFIQSFYIYIFGYIYK